MPAVFDYEVRLLECRSCGAPLRLSPAEGEYRCPFCGATMRLEARHIDATPGAAPPAEAEAARLAQLASQTLTPQSRYDTANVAPYGLERMLKDPPELHNALTWLHEEWRDAVLRLRTAPSGELEYRVFWVAVHIGELCIPARDFEHRRTIQETALELLADVGYRNILRCLIARAALALGERQAAEAWLGACDPQPNELEVDSELRESRALLACVSGDFKGVLRWVGAARFDIPVSRRLYAALASLRIHALDALGRPQDADREMRWLIWTMGGLDRVALYLRNSPFRLCGPTLDRLQQA